MRRSVILLLSVFLGLNQVVFSRENDISSGLFFSSHEVTQDKRTSLHLTPENDFVFHKKFRLSFEVMLRNEDGFYGLICRVLGNKEVNIDLVSNTAAPSSNFWLVYKDQILYSYSYNEIPNSQFGQWLNVAIDFDLKQNELTTTINGIEKKQKVSGLSLLKDFDFIYGASNNPKFQNTDVATMTLRNVVIADDNNKARYNWKLAKHGPDFVLDEVNKSVATVKNGIWLIDKHVQWTEKALYTLPDLAGIAKNEQDGLLYIICKTKLYIYSVQNNNLDTLNYAKGCPFKNYYNYFIYKPSTHKIISYDFSENYLNEFDFTTREWKQSSYAYKEPDNAHHNTIISPVNGNLTTFGGYGHYAYKAKIFEFNAEKSTWNTNDLAGTVYPRYLSAAGLDENNQWLIFGGYGSKSGRQEVSPEFFYDLYAYDFKTRQAKKLQVYKVPEVPFVPCEGLIKNPESNSFYTLIYNTNNFTTSLKLAEFSISKPEYKVYSEAIPYKFSDIESWCVLFLCQKTASLVAATIHNNDVAIYTLAYPALAETDVVQVNNPTNAAWLFIVAGLIVIGVVVTVILRRINTSKPLPAIKDNAPVFAPNIVDLNAERVNAKSSIYFLGGFQVIDKEGNDISSVFTPTLKQLFIILLMTTVKNGRGISTTKLDESLWSDKSDNSARNNRNVSISKLRTILTSVGNVEIDQESSYWRINMSGVYSDYVELNMLCERFKEQNKSLSKAEIQHFVQVAYRGELLPEFQLEWLDAFKADFSNLMIDTLFEFANLPENQKNMQLLNDLSDCILKYDPINEDALALKCGTLYKLGKKGLAKTAYDHFKKEYENLLGTEFSVSFNDIIEK
jgi:two-component SAPR family response regulator